LGQLSVNYIKAIKCRYLRNFGGRAQPIVAQLIDSGSLSLEDIREAEQLLKALARAQTESGE